MTALRDRFGLKLYVPSEIKAHIYREENHWIMDYEERYDDITDEALINTAKVLSMQTRILHENKELLGPKRALEYVSVDIDKNTKTLRVRIKAQTKEALADALISELIAHSNLGELTLGEVFFYAILASLGIALVQKAQKQK